jgi:hypothetical protein
MPNTRCNRTSQRDWVFLQVSQCGDYHNLMLQVSTLSATSPLQAEAKALLFAAIITGFLQLQEPKFQKEEA